MLVECPEHLLIALDHIQQALCLGSLRCRSLPEPGILLHSVLRALTISLPYHGVTPSHPHGFERCGNGLAHCADSYLPRSRLTFATTAELGSRGMYLGSWLNFHGHWNILRQPNILSLLFALLALAGLVDTVVLPSSSPVPFNTQMSSLSPDRNEYSTMLSAQE